MDVTVNKIPIIKLSNKNGQYYPLSVPESVYTTHEYPVKHDIGDYKAGDIVNELTTLDEILSKILGDEKPSRAANFIGVTVTYPGPTDLQPYPPYLELDTGEHYNSDQYAPGDVVIYTNDGSNILCIFYTPKNEDYGKWLMISDDILWVGDENNPPPTRSEKKVLWLDTTERPLHSYADSPEMESVKNLIYKLMLAYSKVVKLVENGIKPTDASGVVTDSLGNVIAPGTEASNWRKELINAADPEQPIDVVPSDELYDINIYGNDYTANGSIYRAVFTPNGFIDKRAKWTFANGKTVMDLLSKTTGYPIAKVEIITETDESGSSLYKPECHLDVYMWDSETQTKSPIIYTDILDTPIELVATHDFNNYAGDEAIIGRKTIKVGGEKPETDVEPTVRSVCIKLDTSENFTAHKDNLTDGEILFYTDKAKFAVYRCFKTKNKKGEEYWQQKFYTLKTDDSEQDGLTVEQLYELKLSYLQFKAPDGTIYKVSVDSDGNWKTRPISDKYENGTDRKYASISKYLSMSMIYCGGNISNKGKISHNFVEIYNSAERDINLSGTYLLYTACVLHPDCTPDKKGYIWEVLPLEGIIKAGSTFTIRGARCNRDDASFINIDKYDMEWFTQEGNLIEFDTKVGGFYFFNGVDVTDDQGNVKRSLPDLLNELLTNHNFTTCVTEQFKSGELPSGYIDGFGFQRVKGENNISYGNVPAEASKAILLNSDSVSEENKISSEKCIFIKNFILDPSNQALKDYSSKKTNVLWTFVNIDRQTTKLGNSVQYYWDDSIKKTYKPGCVSDKHNFYNYGRTKFSSNKPNAINVTFGIQATETVTYPPTESHGVKYYVISEIPSIIKEAKDNNCAYDNTFTLVTDTTVAVYTTDIKYAKFTSNKDATRCFNWISVDNYDEYIKIRKIGESEWKIYYSITENDATNPDSIIINEENQQVPAPFIKFYKRFTWPAGYDNVWVTTHKVIIRGLETGTYEYQICRKDDNAYVSDVKTFKVKSDRDVTGFSFVQTSDQQGFNYAEYLAWKRSCYMINKSRNENHIVDTETRSPVTLDFTINTGDIGQSGNRVSEFLDYFNGHVDLSDLPEMFTVGNNDLCSNLPTKFCSGEDYDSKYNPVNIRKYYTFELDPRNVDSFGKSNYYVDSVELPITYPSTPGEAIEYKQFNNIEIDSMYSFNYGKYHFVCLNSEYCSATVTLYNDIVYDGTVKTVKDGNANVLVKSINKQMELWLDKDLNLWKSDHNENDCRKCFVYMHEIPYTIITNDFLNGGDKTERGGCKLNTFNDMGNYRYSRLFKKYGIRMIFGGHKHTYSLSRPVYDAPAVHFAATPDETADPIIVPGIPDEQTTSVTKFLSRKPVVQFIDIGADKPGKGFYTFNDANTQLANYTDKLYLAFHLLDADGESEPGWYIYNSSNSWTKTVKDSDNNECFTVVNSIHDGTDVKDTPLTVRCEFVKTYNAPIYVMSQATGFKLISNKELMCHHTYKVPWIKQCCNQRTYQYKGGKPGRDQLNPMYIEYTMNSDTDTVHIEAISINGIMSIGGDDDDGYSASCDLNTQTSNLTYHKVFEQTLENV